MSSGQILIVDDDKGFVELYREILTGAGHAVEVASKAAEAIDLLSKPAADFDVVLIDQKLQGPGGPDSGLELLKTVQNLAPFAKPIIVTGYASPEAIEAAFAAGVYDYLVKNGAFEALLKAKVRNAVEITTERRLNASRSPAQLKAAWHAALKEADPQKKGALLERVMNLLFRAIPGFGEVTANLRTDSEEIDIVVRNSSTDLLWSKESQYFFGECKNWSKPSGAPQARDFLSKLETKHERGSIGFYFSVGGFTSEFAQELAKRSTDRRLVITFDAQQISDWIESGDPLKHLSDRHQKAVTAAR